MAETSTVIRSGASASRRYASAAILLFGALLSWLCYVHPGWLPFWAPWDFSWPEFLGTAFPLWWFLHGLALTPPQARPAPVRCAAFLLGLAVIYAVLQTRFDYMAQHMFFLNRIQHVVMHHLGPILIALAAGGPTVKRGMPAVMRRFVESLTVRTVLGVLQQPVIAVLLFVGLFYFWLIPAVHFRAMLDARLYAVMNWSMVLDGVLFWVLVLDLRPKPPARFSFGTRAAMAYATTFPEIIIGTVITSVHHDLYPFYALCGRLFPSVSPIADQQIGGIIIWVPPAMMSAAATLIVLHAFVRHEEALAGADASPASPPNLAEV